MSVFSDFDWSWRGVRVRETGAEIAFDLDLIKDVWRGGYYIFREKLRRPPQPLPIKIEYAPRAPRPWYLLWGTLRQAGLTQTSFGEHDNAVLVVHFSDLTQVETKPSKHASLNGDCTDISKSHVAHTFQSVFGYALSIDPETVAEPFLEKGEENGIHDGKIQNGPVPAEPGRVYQKLIDNRTQNGTVLDLRCPTVFGEIPLVFLKERPIDRRFENLNTRVRLAAAADYFSVDTFCAAMKLDWGGLDILRHADDGRIYIVDVNKTDMGPPLALPIKEKLSAVKTLGQALRDALIERL